MQRLKSMFLFPFLGLVSLVWFLIRVIPKPSRAAYPCVRAAAPLASSFVVYLMGLFGSVVLFKKAKRYMLQSRTVLFSLALTAAVLLAVFSFLQDAQPVKAVSLSLPQEPNQPVGTGVGVKPGRVVWVHSPDAVNEKLKQSGGDYWYTDKNTDQEEVHRMVSRAIKILTAQPSDADAWDAMFKYFNERKGKGAVGYTAGEKIVIKINLNGNGCSYNSNDFDHSSNRNIDTSPQVVYAVLHQLVNVVGVAQSDIGFGDPGRNVDDRFWDKFHDEFPDVQYWGNGNGRTKIERSSKKAMYTSDGSMSDYLPKPYQTADYMINLPVFKKHHRAGISLTSKNHFGTFVPFQGSAFHWHFSLPAADGGADVSNPDYGMYRCFVDIMGHEKLGGNTILYLIDGLWSSTNWAHPPIKWAMEPFNDDYPSSIFASMDPVAIESVGYDFLYEEFGEDHPTEGDYDPSDNRGPFPHYEGVDDFLHQAAHKDNWAVEYDPENDGTELPASMGVHEHWNNASDKLYSRDMGKDEGVELVKVIFTSIKHEPDVVVSDFRLLQNYPNPFNPSTNIRYELSRPSKVQLAVYQIDGTQIRTLVAADQGSGAYTVTWDGRLENGHAAPSGVYVYRITIQDAAGRSIVESRKMILSR